MEQWRTVLHSQAELKDANKPLRSQSPTGQSPINKTRKASQPVTGKTWDLITQKKKKDNTVCWLVPDQIPSPKSKTWKGKFIPFRRSGAPSSPTYPEGATVGVPLEVCPPSSDNPLVALLVARCTAIVEALGLDIVGIYRVPGNKAAIAALTDAVNKGIHNVPLDVSFFKFIL